MAQEDNYLNNEDRSALMKMLQIHGTDSLSGLQRQLLGLGPVAQVQQEEAEFSPPIERYSAREPRGATVYGRMQDALKQISEAGVLTDSDQDAMKAYMARYND